jgi:hypothetical protein
MSDDSIEAQGGRLVEDGFELVLTKCNYRCIRYGIEHVIVNPLKLSRLEYTNLNINPTAKVAPDFFVASKDLKTAHLVECKYRSSFYAEGLRQDLLPQAQCWPQIVVVVVRGDRGVKNLDRIKCGQLKTDSGILKMRKSVQTDWVDWSHDAWDNLGEIQDWFPELTSDELLLKAFGRLLDGIPFEVERRIKSKMLEAWNLLMGESRQSNPIGRADSSS